MLQFNLSTFPQLNTKRRLLRKVTSADVNRIYKLRSNEEVLRYLDRPPISSEEDAKLFIEKNIASEAANKTILWGIALQEQPLQLIGTIGFWKTDPEHFRAEIGYMLLPEYFNKGYMQEAIKAVITYAFTETTLHSIEANINPDTLASANLLEKNGFKKEAHFRENFYYNGKFLDSIIYSLVKQL